MASDKGTLESVIRAITISRAIDNLWGNTLPDEKRMNPMDDLESKVVISHVNRSGLLIITATLTVGDNTVHVTSELFPAKATEDGIAATEASMRASLADYFRSQVRGT